MALFRYIGSRERIVAGPWIRVLSPGDTVEAASNPDPLLFRLVETAGGSA